MNFKMLFILIAIPVAYSLPSKSIANDYLQYKNRIIEECRPSGENKIKSMLKNEFLTPIEIEKILQESPITLCGVDISPKSTAIYVWFCLENPDKTTHHSVLTVKAGFTPCE